VDFGSPQ